MGLYLDWAECALWRQVVMAVFSYLYFNSYVAREVSVTVGSVLQVRHKPYCAEYACRDITCTHAEAIMHAWITAGPVQLRSG